MGNIELKCPSCRKMGIIEISDEIIDKCQRGIVAINLGKNQICSHSFIAYIDKNLDIRDCILTDFQIELPQLEIKKKDYKVDIPSDESMNIDLIKLNLYPKTLAFLLRLNLFKKSSIIINDNKFLNNHYEKFLSFIFHSLFEINTLILTKNEYKINKNKFDDYIIVEGNNIIKDKEDVLNIKKLKVEEKIVYKFFSEMDTKTSVILLRNEIYKTHILIQSIKEFLKSIKEKEKIDIMRIVNVIKEIHKIEINTDYLGFLIEIIKNYYGIAVPVIYKNVLGFL